MHTQKSEYPGYGELFAYAKWFKNKKITFSIVMIEPEQWYAYCDVNGRVIMCTRMKNPIDAVAELARLADEALAKQ